MKWLKKYIAIFIMLSVFPVIWVIGKMFVLDASTEIYAYIPQESDIVIEINNPNFIEEFAYQRIFNESYVLEKISIEEAAVEDFKTGVDYFSKIVLFREQWANEDIWIAIVGYTNQDHFRQYMSRRMKDAHIQFGEKHAIVQLNKSMNQEQLDEHLKAIANKEIKPFTARVDLRSYFHKDKEINCYFIPPSSNTSNQLIDGFLNLDFHQDHIDIQGEFTPVSGFDQHAPIAYSIDENAAFSLRSSLNIFNSIFWFSSERIENLPAHDQMALDYDGVKVFLVDKNWGYEFPFKTFPELEMRIDFNKQEKWSAFLDTLQSHQKIRLDTTTKILTTRQGAFFQYDLSGDRFEMSYKGTNFEPSENQDIYFDFQMKIKPLLDNTKFAVDDDNPPPVEFQMIGMSIAEEMLDELYVFDNIEQIRFQMIKESENKVAANGKVIMSNKEGQSVIEGMYFITEAMFFIKDF
ncbi:MAG: hypothetical protein R2780_07715 [Crocinitomicaceae bacterium]